MVFRTFLCPPVLQGGLNSLSLFLKPEVHQGFCVDNLLTVEVTQMAAMAAESTSVLQAQAGRTLYGYARCIKGEA